MPSDSTTQLQRILDRVKIGDKRAHDELIERVCDRLHRLTRTLFRDFHRLRRFDDSADVLQNSLLRLTRRLRNLAETRPGEACRLPATVSEFFSLATIEIRNALLDLARHYFGPHGQARHEVMRAKVNFDGSSSPRQEPTDDTHNPARLQLWTEFHKHVEALPAEQREVFELRWYQGLSSEETAEVLGTSLATVKRRWLSARLALQPFLDDGLLKG